MSAPTILLVEDDPQIRRYLRAYLPAEGFRLLEAEDGAGAIREAAARSPDVVLLDLGLPDLDGVDVVRRLREWSAVPVIVLSARGRERDKVEALDAGADDYLVKPFGMEELLARVRVALRHASATAPGEPVLRAGELEIDFERREARVAGGVVRLTPTEWKLLVLLARNAGKVVTHRQLLREVWGPNAVEHTHYLRVQMYGLRHKLEPDPARPRWLQTETGVGYRFTGRDDG